MVTLTLTLAPGLALTRIILLSGRRATATVKGKGDPGYGATAKMLGETGLCLSLDPHPDAAGGVLTPWTALGETLVTRLRKAEGGGFMSLGVQ